MRRFRGAITVVSMVVTIVGAGRGRAQETLQSTAQAPANTAVLRHVRGGAYFVAADLKKQYDDLVAQIGRLKADVAAHRVTGVDALKELDQLTPRLDALRKEIEDRKVLVSPWKLQQQTEEVTFALGNEQRIILTADDLHVIGWDGPGVKCVLEKTLLATADQPEEAEFQAMKIVHRREVASELVGRTAEENAAAEKEFLATPREKPLTEEQLASRRALVNDIVAGFAPFGDFQGKEVDVVEIEGLTYEQGNRQVSTELKSQGGGGSSGSDWRRHASLTVYVPKSRGVLLRGCLKGLAVEGVEGPLTVTARGSIDRDYNGLFAINGISGPAAIYNVPLGRVEGVRGDVTITATVEYANTGTTHAEGRRLAYTPAPRECTIVDVQGSLSAWFSRVTLRLERIAGRVDVRNEAGDTVLAVEKSLPDGAHRVISNSGRIDVQFAKGAIAGVPVMALTTEGTVETSYDDATLQSTNFTTGLSTDGSRRDWRGFMSSLPPEQRFEAFGRLGRALSGDEKAPGLMLISRSGAVALAAKP